MGEDRGILLKNSPVIKKKMKSLMEPTEWIVISLGGSLIVPLGGIDTVFIHEFRGVIHSLVKKGMRFIIVCGGGQTARDYQDALKSIDPDITDIRLDWLGIGATELNAQLVASVFRDIADQNVITEPHKKIVTRVPIVFASGWRPECSTDYVAVILASNVGATQIINLSDIDCVYDTDPKGKNGKKAKRIKNISWSDYLRIIPKKFTAGQKSPFDPVASREAQKRGLEVAIMNGHNLADLESYLYPMGSDFMGTRINGILPLEFHPSTQGFKGKHIFPPIVIRIT
ncbi:MAG: UMP kinase [Patescibacteria group bacterium]